MEWLIVFGLPLMLALAALRWGHDSRDNMQRDSMQDQRNRSILCYQQHHD